VNAGDLPDGEELVLITRGRKTGREHRVSLWFAQDGDLLWLRADERTRTEEDAAGWAPRRSGRGPDWYRNLLADPRCRVVIGDREHEALYEPSTDPIADLRCLVELWRAKYGPEWVQDWYVEKGRVPVKLRLGQTDAKAREERLPAG